MDAKTLNRIKIKDLFAAIKKDICADSKLRLMYLESIFQKEEKLLKDANDNDLREAQGFFVERKLGISYFPSQNKKTIQLNDQSKIVSIETIYGSENV